MNYLQFQNNSSKEKYITVYFINQILTTTERQKETRFSVVPLQILADTTNKKLIYFRYVTAHLLKIFT